MRILLLASALSLLSTFIFAQDQYYEFMFMASPQGDNLYMVDDPSLDFDHSKEFPVVAIQSDKRTYGTKLGTAKFHSQDEETTTFKVQLNTGVSLDENENIIIKPKILDENPYYEGVLIQALSLGVSITNDKDEPMANSTMRLFNGIIYEEFVLSQLLAALANPKNADQKITKGKWSGKTMAEAARAAQTDDLRAALAFLVDNPTNYAGKNIRLSKLFADWIKAATPSKLTYDKTASLGVQLKSHRSKYLQVSAIDARYWGHLSLPTLKRFSLVPNLSPGVIVFSINGESTYQKSADYFLDKPLKIGEVVKFQFLSLDNKVLVNQVTLRGALDNSKATWIEEPLDLGYSYPKLFPIVKDKKWGYIDANGYEIIPPQFDKLGMNEENFKEGLMPVEKDGKWGYINIKGDWIIEPKFEGKSYPFSDGLAPVVAEKDGFGFSEKFHYIDHTGKVRIKHDGSKLKPMLSGKFEDGLCPFKDTKTELYGYMNKKGEVALKAKYHYVTDFKAGLAKVKMEADESYGIIDTKGDWLFEPEYSYIYINKKDKQIFWSKDRKTYHLSDLSGKKLFTFASNPMSVFGASDFSNGYIRSIGENKKKGLLNDKGKQVISNKYNHIHHRIDNGLLAVTETGVKDKFTYKGGWYFIDIKTGKKVIEGPFEEVGGFRHGTCWVKTEKNLWGLINTKGEWLVEPSLDKHPSTLTPNLHRYDSGSLLKGKNYIYFNNQGNIVWQDK